MRFDRSLSSISSRFDLYSPALRLARLTAFISAIVLVSSLCPETIEASYEGFDPAVGAIVQLTDTSTGKSSAPAIRAFHLTDGQIIQIDGRLDEGVWRSAETGGGFRIWDPDRGCPASEQTAFKVAFDKDAIYFAVACLENDPSRISKSLSRRDSFSNSDLVSIYIDPYHDRTTGYNFRVNPLGVQQDSYIFNDGDRDDDWNAVWEAETTEDEEGWYAEFRIPFSAIRYRPTTSTWGLQIYRYMHGRGEDTAWITWDRDTPGFVSRFGQITGLHNVPAPRQLEITPYAVARATDLSMTGEEEIDNFQNFGADLKYGVTADLTLNATFQPDFGQVEADPAVLNLSPYETWYQEKRPFFIEGNRFFEHRGFRMFYSRRIGTGDENSRIRYATKLTGKTAGDISLATLVASTDVTEQGKTHNFLKEGSQASHYLVSRLGKEFNEGNHSFNLMQTAVVNSASREEFGDYASREAYTTGADFSLQFRDRAYRMQGSFAGSVIDHEADPSTSSRKGPETFGTGGMLEFMRLGGKLRASVYGRWETEKLDLNDIGFLHAPDELSTGCWFGYRINPDGSSSLFNRISLNFNGSRGWMYAGRSGYDYETGEKVWAYSKGHRRSAHLNINGWMQFRGFQEAWFGVGFNPEGTQRYETRSEVLLEDGEYADIPGGGPLIDEPTTYGGWIGANTDSRKCFVLSANVDHWRDVADNISTSGEIGLRWNQTSCCHHELEVEFYDRTDDTQHIENFHNPGGGIGDISYVFGHIHQQTLDLTLRTSILFSRNQSLEIYAQPYLTVGDYTNARELARADTYDLVPYEAEGFRVEDEDFEYSSVNLNVVYRWEYRPGSTLYLVFTHSRDSYDQRGYYDQGADSRFDNRLNGEALFDNEPENVFLAKITYWLPI